MRGPILKTFGVQHWAATQNSTDSPRLSAGTSPRTSPGWAGVEQNLAGNILTIKEAENFAQLPAPTSDPGIVQCANVASWSPKTTSILKLISVAWLKIGSPVII